MSHRDYDYRCDNCGKGFDDLDDMNYIEDLAERTEAGQQIPAGQCPKCGALCYDVDGVTLRESEVKPALEFLAALACGGSDLLPLYATTGEEGDIKNLSIELLAHWGKRKSILKDFIKKVIRGDAH